MSRALRQEYEALQVRAHRAREALPLSCALEAAEAARLRHELESLEATLSSREARMARQRRLRPVADRLAAFGFLLLFVAPSVALVGIAGGRTLRTEPEVAVLLLILGVLLLAAWVTTPIRTALLRLVSPPWRVARRLRRLADNPSPLPLSPLAGRGLLHHPGGPS